MMDASVYSRQLYTSLGVGRSSTARKPPILNLYERILARYYCGGSISIDKVSEPRGLVIEAQLSGIYLVHGPCGEPHRRTTPEYRWIIEPHVSRVRRGFLASSTSDQVG
jgi:hypothetical protein